MAQKQLSSRVKPTKKPGETYPLKLTWHQWESLIHCTRIKNKIKERLQEAGEGTQIFGITRKELDPDDPKMKYALCVEGERACPPENNGRTWDYGYYLSAIP